MSTTTTIGLTTPTTHLDAFSTVERSLPGHDRPAIARLRRAGIARFGELGFPGERNEDWKYTSVAPLVRTPMQLRIEEDLPGISHGPLPAGVVVMSLTDALARHPDLVEPHLGQHADFKNHPFVALNTAFWSDGVFIHVPAGIVVETPVQLDLTGEPQEGGPYLRYRRLLVVVGRGSQVILTEQHRGQTPRGTTNIVSEYVLDEEARIDHYKVQDESPEAFHIAVTQAVVGSQANFSTHYIGLGGALVRNEVRVLFAGEHAEATVNGLYRGQGAQHHDNHTVIDHARALCSSHELYKGILDDRAHGVFNGKIFVRPGAQKTDAKQTNQTLLLSDDATINTKPQLEIFADDVKCTHGATVGQLDEQQLFYLRSRGIAAEQARALLTFAFANDIISRIKVSSLREHLERAMLEASHLPRLEDSESE